MKLVIKLNIIKKLRLYLSTLYDVNKKQMRNIVYLMGCIIGILIYSWMIFLTSNSVLIIQITCYLIVVGYVGNKYWLKSSNVHFFRNNLGFPFIIIFELIIFLYSLLLVSGSIFSNNYFANGPAFANKIIMVAFYCLIIGVIFQFVVFLRNSFRIKVVFK